MCEIIFYVCSFLCNHPCRLWGVDSNSIVSIESEGPYAPERLFPEAVKVMREKLAVITEAAVALRAKYSSFDKDISMADI